MWVRSTHKHLSSCFQKWFYFFNAFRYKYIFCKKLDQYNEYVISTVGTDGLVLQHQAISTHSVVYASMRSQFFMG